MDGSAGHHTAAATAVPAAPAVMNRFHVVDLAAGKLTLCRQPIQHDTCGHPAAPGICCTGSDARS
ncbi:transposase [Corynebacterium meridianum]